MSLGRAAINADRDLNALRSFVFWNLYRKWPTSPSFSPPYKAHFSSVRYSLASDSDLRRITNSCWRLRSSPTSHWWHPHYNTADRSSLQNCQPAIIWQERFFLYLQYDPSEIVQEVRCYWLGNVDRPASSWSAIHAIVIFCTIHLIVVPVRCLQKWLKRGFHDNSMYQQDIIYRRKRFKRIVACPRPRTGQPTHSWLQYRHLLLTAVAKRDWTMSFT